MTKLPKYHAPSSSGYRPVKAIETAAAPDFSGEVFVKGKRLDSDSSGGGSGGGDVVGPASSVANDIALFDGLTGKLLKDSGILVSDLLGLAPGSDTRNTIVPTGDFKNLVLKMVADQTKYPFSVTDSADALKAYITPSGNGYFRGTSLSLGTGAYAGNISVSSTYNYMRITPNPNSGRLEINGYLGPTSKDAAVNIFGYGSTQAAPILQWGKQWYTPLYSPIFSRATISRGAFTTQIIDLSRLAHISQRLSSV